MYEVTVRAETPGELKNKLRTMADEFCGVNLVAPKEAPPTNVPEPAPPEPVKEDPEPVKEDPKPVKEDPKPEPPPGWDMVTARAKLNELRTDAKYGMPALRFIWKAMGVKKFTEIDSSRYNALQRIANPEFLDEQLKKNDMSSFSEAEDGAALTQTLILAFTEEANAAK